MLEKVISNAVMYCMNLRKTRQNIFLSLIRCNLRQQKKKKKRQPNICGTSLPADQKEDPDVPNGNHIQS
jgi:hypothetical protein